MLRFARLVTALALLLLLPSLALAQTRAGVVTNLEGSATAARSRAPQPVALKFKDDVLLNDRIVTGDRSIVRMLLGGKAVVTVRERSALTITEVPGKSTIDLDSGKIAVAVAKDRMKPGELLEVKTPNAIAAVRGTVFIIEVVRATAQATPGPGGVTTNVFGFSDTVDLDYFLSGRTLAVGPNTFASGTGSQPPSFGTMTPSQAQSAVSGLHVQGQSVGEGQNGAKDNVVGTTLATFGQGGGLPQPTAIASLVSQNRTLLPTPTPPLLPGGPKTLEESRDILSPRDVLPPPPDVLPPPPVVLPPPPVVPPPDIFPAGVITPDSISRLSGPLNSPPFGALVPNGLVTDQYKGFGVLFGPARVGIFSDPPNAWGGVNAGGIVDLIAPVEVSFVKPGATNVPATTSHLSVEVGFSGVGSLTLEAFNLAGVLIGSTLNGPALGPHGRTLATLDIAGIHSFRVSGRDTWGMNQIEFGELIDLPAVLMFAGPLFQSVGEQRSAVSAFFDITNVTILGQSTDPLIWLQGSTLTTVHQFAALLASDVTAASSFVRLENGAEIIQTSAAEPLVSMRGGSLDVGTGGTGHLFDVAGRPANTQVDAETGLTLGTDRPLQPGAEAPVFEATHATVNVRGSAYRVDTALLEATAPLLNLAGGTAMATGAHVVDLVGRARVSIPNDAIAMINLNASSLTVANGNLVNVAGGSKLNLAGSLLSLGNGSTVNILNGLLLNVTGGSSVSIGGSLVSFSGAGNLLNVTNRLAPTAMLGGVPVYGPTDSLRISGAALAGLGSAGAIKINGVTLTPTTPLSSLTGSLVAVQGGGTVKVGN